MSEATLCRIAPTHVKFREEYTWEVELGRSPSTTVSSCSGRIEIRYPLADGPSTYFSDIERSAFGIACNESLCNPAVPSAKRLRSNRRIQGARSPNSSARLGFLAYAHAEQTNLIDALPCRQGFGVPLELSLKDFSNDWRMGNKDCAFTIDYAITPPEENILLFRLPPVDTIFNLDPELHLPLMAWDERDFESNRSTFLLYQHQQRTARQNSLVLKPDIRLAIPRNQVPEGCPPKLRSFQLHWPRPVSPSSFMGYRPEGDNRVADLPFQMSLSGNRYGFDLTKSGGLPFHPNLSTFLDLGGVHPAREHASFSFNDLLIEIKEPIDLMGRVYLEGCLQLSIQDTLLSGTEFRYFHPDGSLGFACHAKTGVGAPPINLPPACFPSPGNRVLTVETLINVNFRIPIDDLAVGNHHHRARTFRIDNATTDNSALANRLRQFLIEEGFQAAQDFVSGSQFPKTLRGIRGLNAAFAADCKTPDGQRDEIRCLILVTGQRRTIQTGASRGGQTRQGEEDIANLSVTLVLTSRGENVQHARMLSRLAVNLENQLLSLTRRTI